MNKYKNLVLDDSNIRNTRSLLFILFLLSVSVIINVNARLYEKNVWIENPTVSQLRHSIDSFWHPAYYVKIAQYLKKDELFITTSIKSIIRLLVKKMINLP